MATYGQVAALAGLPRRARLVGRVLQHLDPASDIPWHRVVNAKGEVCYSPSRNGGDALQQRLLEKEGVHFDDRSDGHLRLHRHATPRDVPNLHHIRADRLSRAGVPVELHVYPRAYHGFYRATNARVTKQAEHEALADD